MARTIKFIITLAPEDIIHTENIGLLPLVSLTNGGATRKIVQKMLTDLQAPEHQELALVGYTLAYLIFKRKYPEDLDWLERSYKGMQDILHESPLYQMILQEGEVKGEIKGHAKGLTEGIALSIISLVQAHFPELKDLSIQQVATIKNATLLNHLLIKISMASNAEEARSLLLNPPEEEPQENG